MGKKARRWKRTAELAQAANRALSAQVMMMETEMLRLSTELAGHRAEREDQRRKDR